MSKIVDRPMNTTELKELKSLVKGEFAIIAKELTRRRDKLEAEAEQHVRDTFAERIEAAKIVQERFKAEVEEFKERVKAFEDEQREHGIAPSNGYNGRPAPAVSISMADSWAPIGMKEAIDKAKREVRDQAAEASLQLDRREHEYIKRVTATAIVSSEAKSLFAELPAMKDILPMNAAVQAADAAVLEVTAKAQNPDNDDEYDA